MHIRHLNALKCTGGMHIRMDWTAVNFDWNRARSFLVAAEEGSLTAAARALDMSQPTLGRQISALELELGVTLFERVPNGLVLTESGQNLIAHVKQMSEAASRFSLVASGQSQLLEGSVCISASEIDAYFRLPPIIANIRQLEPGIDLEIIVSNDVSNLTKREADIALRSFRPTQPDLIAKKLFEDPIWLYGTNQYLTPFKELKSLKESTNIQVIGFDKTDMLINVLNERGFNFTHKNISTIAHSHLLHWELVKKHLGLGFFPQDIGDSEPAFMRAFESFGPVMTLPLWLVCHRELHTNLRVKRVFQLIADAFKHKSSKLA